MVNEALNYSFAKILGLGNLLTTLFDIFTFAELTFFLVYFYLISANRILKRYIPFIFIFFAIFIVVDLFIVREQGAFNTMSTAVEAIIILSLCIYYFYEQLRDPNTILVYTQQSFWIIIAFLIFQSGTFFVYLYIKDKSQYDAHSGLYSTINSSFIILKNILFSIAMLKKPEIKVESGFPSQSLVSDWDNFKP